MSKLPFAKYSGLGNDFILFEKKSFLRSIEEDHRDLPQWISSLCHRRRSVGGDGVVLYEQISHDRFALDFYNSDGSFAALCGNGLRCAAHYLSSQDKSLKSIWIQTTHFLHHCQVDGSIVTCTMQVPLYLGSYSFLDGTAIDANIDWHLLECGVPHIIKVLTKPSDIRAVSLHQIGHALQRRGELPVETVNVSVLQIEEDSRRVLIRTYERGVFQETEACGTAAMSGAALLSRLFPSKSNWVFHFAGFNPEIQNDEAFEVNLRGECKMKAKAEFVFGGILNSRDQ